MMLTLALYRSRSLTSPGGRWRWRLRAANNRDIANGGEGYHNREDALSGALLAIGGVARANNHGQMYVHRLSDEVKLVVDGQPVPAAGEDPVARPRPEHIPGD